MKPSDKEKVGVMVRAILKGFCTPAEALRSLIKAGVARKRAVSGLRSWGFSVS